MAESKKKLSAIYKEVLNDDFPDEMTILLGENKLRYRKRKWKLGGQNVGLRYGDNPGQQAALYQLAESNLKLLGCEFVKPENALVSSIAENDLMENGKHIGKSNLTDVDNALSILKNFDEPTAIIMKHNNPSGVASRQTIAEAFREAYLADRVAAFGGVAALNRPIDLETADQIMLQYLEVVAAPEFEKEALEKLMTKKNIRLIRIKKMDRLKEQKNMSFIDFSSLMDGGMILQRSLSSNIQSEDELTLASVERQGKTHLISRKTSRKEAEDLIFAWKVAQGVVSNAIVIAKNKATVAICPGEQDRVGAVEIAIIKGYKKYSDRLSNERFRIPYIQLDKKQKAEIDRIVSDEKGNIKNGALASDGFFPFRDSVDVAAREGVTAIIQPGGSIKDDEVIDACNEKGITMVFTGQRVFKH